METNTTLTLPFTPTLAAGIAAVLPHVSKDLVTPVITGAVFSNRHLIGTDRYSIGRFEHTTLTESVDRHGAEGPSEPDATWWVPGDALAWLVKQAPAFKGSKTATLNVTGSELVIRYTPELDSPVAASLGYIANPGNFPPVERLMLEANTDPVDAAPFHLGTVMLGKLNKSGAALARPERAKDMPVRFQLAAAASQKLAPIRVSIGDRFDAMIQPVPVR